MDTFHRMVFDGPGERSEAEKNIPRDKDYPPDAVQCDSCGGLGQTWITGGSDLTNCPTCEGRGWLPKGHPKGRHCSREECNKPLPPDRYQVYCSNQCAYDDA